MEKLKILMKYLAKSKLQFFLMLILVLLNSRLQLLYPNILSKFIDNCLENSNKAILMKLATEYIVIILINIGISVFITYISQTIGWNAINKLQEDLVNHIMKLDISFYKEKTKGELIEIIDGDVNILFNFFSKLTISFLSNILVLLGVLFFYLKMDYRIGIVQIFFSIFVFIALNKLKKRGVELRKKERSFVGKLAGLFSETLDCSEDLQGNGAKKYIYSKYNNIIVEWLPIKKKVSVSMWSMSMLILGLQALGYSLVFILGTLFWKKGIITVGTIYLFYNYTQYILDPINNMQYQMQEFQKVGASLSRVDSLLKTRMTLNDFELDYEIKSNDELKMEHVYFSYDPEYEFLKDINIKIKPGHTVGILGKSGSGKTTIASLFIRFYDVSKGTILIGQTNIKNMSLKSLRKQIVYVTQEVQILDASIRDNITFYNKSITDLHIFEAIDKMSIKQWFSKFENGLDTIIGTGGIGLSDGEAQLLTLLRAFTRNPKIVILDEVTSKLDAETEKQLRLSIEYLLKDRIGVIIAHRLQTIENTDQIIILQDGQVVEQGMTSELLTCELSLLHQLISSTKREEVIYG